MATYFNGSSEIEGGDGLQTLVLMNPGYVYYPDAAQLSSQPPQNFVFPEHPSQKQQFVGIPLSAAASPPSHHHAFLPIAPQYGYNSVEMAAGPPPPRELTPFQQGLSLTLSSHQSGLRSHAAAGGNDGRPPVGGSTSAAAGFSNGVNMNMQSVLLSSKYLKATQELLEEVVNLGKGAPKSSENPSIKTVCGGGSPAAAAREGLSKEESGNKHTELTTAERQDIQMKKAKLVNMLDEVEQRYRQYHNQMQMVISWFEQAAGIRSAKTYTELALQTISKQFRCLKDSIMGQIKAASRNLGEEEDGFGGGGRRSDGGSRLKFVDNQLRQQRALQQLGMIQHNAWRPQRGLPERSVSVLRAWLFEHFLHPYPKDSDKHMLAKQTGLTRSQVSNWFINARVRLWKPMVEEMYLEEIKEQKHIRNNEKTEKNSSSKQEKSNSPENSNSGFNQTSQNIHPPPPQMAVSTSPHTTTNISFQNPSSFTHNGSLEMGRMTQFGPKKPRNDSRGFTLMGNPTDFMDGFGGYPIAAEQFQPRYSGNRVSLTLGLPHRSESFLPNQNIQLGRNLELEEDNEFDTMNPSSSSHSAAMYETINIENRKRFAAQLLPDFVA